jgi:serine/threonine protein kinase
MGQFARDPRGESTLLRKLAQNPNPHIVQWIAEYEDDQEFCMVLELCRGGSLFDLLSASHNPEVARFFFRQVVEGVGHIHSTGVAHLNLDLENLLLDKDCVKVANFVFARSALTPITTAIHTLPGHKQFMAPEVFQNIPSVDGRKADMWSLGVVLFALLTGMLPFQLPCNSDAAFFAVTQGTGIPAMGLPSSASALLSQLLSLSPSSRPSADEVLASEWMQAS